MVSKNFKLLAAPLLMAASLSMGGCAVNSMGRDGVRTHGTEFLGAGVTHKTFEEPVARGNVLQNGLNNPVIAAPTRNAICNMTQQQQDETGVRITQQFKVRDQWETVSGGTPMNCTPQSPLNQPQNNVPSQSRPQPTNPRISAVTGAPVAVPQF